VFYGNKLASALGQDLHVLTIGEITNLEDLALYGATNIHQISKSSVVDFDSQQFAKAISAQADALEASTVIFAHSAQGKSVAGRVAVRMQAGLVSAVNSIPEISDGFSVGKSLFSGKALAKYQIEGNKRVLTLVGNAVLIEEVSATPNIQDSSIALEESKIKVVKTSTVEGIVPLPEAELVVSAGRGMKGPENWGVIEELADAMGATTACSRPVADADWRPHHEHVGQTGVAIRPNLYIAIGISGAIQHLAGVNNSKVIVVINKDEEAPFFKAADYGIVGDLFDVVPKLTAAYNKVMAN
jgi:electron transfer flavoprotein alpha subunit